MRVGLIAPPWLPVPPASYGGTEEVLDVLARGLDNAGHEVSLFATGDSTCPVLRGSIYETAENDRLGATIPELYHALSAYEYLGDCDVIHDHTVAGMFVAPLVTTAPVVSTNHGPFTEELHSIYKAVQGDVAIVAISDDQASQTHGIEIARVIHHGLDPQEYLLGTGAGDYLLFLGRMCPEKGVHHAARVAMASGRRLVIAAKMREPAELRYFEEMVQPLLGNGVIYVGEADQPTKKQLLADAVALVNPICWSEPFGLVMIEALASGTPVLAFAHGSAPEIVDHGVTGFVCSDEAEMVEAVRRVETIDRLACRKIFEDRFTAARMVADHVDLYESVASMRSRPTAA